LDSKELSALNYAGELPNTTDLGGRPIVILGCDTKELSFAALFSLVPSFLSAVLGGAIFGIAFAGVFLFLALAISFAWVTLSIRSAKRQKPRGFYVQRINKRISKLLPDAFPIINYSGHWETRRYRNMGAKNE